MTERIHLTLPYPPSLNRYYRRVGERTHISHAGRAYRTDVWAAVLEQGSPKASGRLAVSMTMHRENRVAFDLDNMAKALLDALQKAGVYENDGQIDDLRIVRGEVRSPGCVELTITPATRDER